MARLPEPGKDNGQWGDILNDYLAQSLSADGSLKTDTVGPAQLKPLSVTTAALVDNSVTIPKLSSVAQANGLASLDGSAKLPEAQVPVRLTDAAIVTTIDSRIQDALSDFEGGPATSDSTKYAAWGDSMTAATYPAVLQTLLSGITVFNGGVGGERSFDIAARQGGNPILVTISGGQIPTSGAVAVVPYRSDDVATTTLMKQGVKGMNPCKILGVEGTFLYSTANSRYEFTRLVAGDAVAAPVYPTPVISNAHTTYQNHTTIIWIGRNNPTMTDRILEDTQAIIGSLAPASPRWLVLGVINATNEPSGSTNHTAITALAARQKAQYGRRFVDIRKLLINYGLQVAGVTPTSQDTTDISNDTVPTSLRSDAVHLNSLGNQLVARFVAERLVEFGWASFVPSPEPPSDDETVIFSDTFNSRANGSIIHNTSTDQGLGGGAPAIWQATTSQGNAWGVQDGVLQRVLNHVAASVVGVQMSTPDYRVDVTVPVLSAFGIAVRRTVITGGSDHRMMVYANGTAQLPSRPLFNYSAGDRIGMRVYGTTLQALINDVVVDEVAGIATITGPGFAGLLVTANNLYQINDFTVRVPA